MKRIVILALLAMSDALAQVPFASDVAVNGKVTATDLVQGSLLRSSANGGLWGIQSRAANQVAIMPGTDTAGYSALEILGAWSATRAATGLLRVYGPATNNWGKYVGLLHDGTSGSLISGEGDLLFSPNWTERMRVVGSSGNVLVGTATDSGYRLDVFGGSARIRNSTVPYLLLQSTGTDSTDGAYLGIQNGNNKNYSIGAYGDGRFFLYDAAASRDFLSYTQGSRLSLQPSGGDTLLSASLRIYNGGNDGNNTGFSSIRTNLGSGNLVINAKSGAVYLNYDHGTGGVIFSNGTGGNVGAMDMYGNFTANLSVTTPTVNATTAASTPILTLTGTANGVLRTARAYSNNYDATYNGATPSHLSSLFRPPVDAFLFATAQDIEYWNGSAWVAWTELGSGWRYWLDGDDSTLSGADETHKKFRLTIPVPSWNHGGIIWVYHEYPQRAYALTVESSKDLATWAQRASGTFSSGGSSGDAYLSIDNPMDDTYLRLTFDVTLTAGQTFNLYRISYLHHRKMQVPFGNTPLRWDWYQNARVTGNFAAGSSSDQGVRLAAIDSTSRLTGMFRNTATSGWTALAVQQDLPSGYMRTIVGANSSGPNGYIGTESNHSLAIRTNNSDRVVVSSTGGVTFYGQNLYLASDQQINFNDAGRYFTMTTHSGGTYNGNYGLYYDKAGEALQLWTASAARLSISGSGLASFGGGVNATTVSAVCASCGYVSLQQGGANNTGYLEWRKADSTRLGYMGWNNSAVQLALENGAKFQVTGGTLEASSVQQINFVYGGSASVAIDNTTVNNVWRAHAYTATISEVACWTDAGTVTLAIKDSAGNMVTSATLSCSSTGASTTSMNTSYNAITSGEGLGFTTSSVSGVKNLSVSIKYTRAY